LSNDLYGLQGKKEWVSRAKRKGYQNVSLVPLTFSDLCPVTLVGAPDSLDHTDYDGGSHDGPQQGDEQGRTGIGSGHQVGDEAIYPFCPLLLGERTIPSTAVLRLPGVL